MNQPKCPPCTGECNQGRACAAARNDSTQLQLHRHLERFILLVGLAIVAAICIVAAPPSQAATFGLHLATAHFGNASAQLNSSTPGIYFRADNGLTVGTYRNSDDRRSVYAAWTWETDDKRFALTAGGVTGYSPAPIVPLLVPSMRIRVGDTYAARLAFLPKPIKHGRAAGLHLSVERSF